MSSLTVLISFPNRILHSEFERGFVVNVGNGLFTRERRLVTLVLTCFLYQLVRKYTYNGYDLTTFNLQRLRNNFL